MKIKEFLDVFNPDRDIREVLDELAMTLKNGFLNKRLDRVFMFSKSYDLMVELEEVSKEEGWYCAAKNALDKLEIKVSIQGKENIPDCGPGVYVANHPWGIVEGLILLGGLGEEVKIRGRKLKHIGTYQNNAVKGIEEVIFTVDTTSGKRGENGKNSKSLRNVLGHLKEGQDLAFFPSAETSYRQGGEVKDPVWKEFLGKISSKAQVVPMWFSGPENCFSYKLASAINPKLRHLFYLREFWDKKGEEIKLNIGEPISSYELKELSSRQKTDKIREVCEGLR